MRRYRDKPLPLHRTLLLCALFAALLACSPSVNWRVIDLHSLGASVLMPCKPEAAQRDIPLQGVPSVMEMRSCESGGVTYAVAWTRLVEPGQAKQAVNMWANASARSAKATAKPELQSWAIPNAQAAWSWQGVGVNAGNQPIDVSLRYVIAAGHAVQMAVYSPRQAEVDRTAFWAGLSLPRR